MTWLCSAHSLLDKSLSTAHRMLQYSIHFMHHVINFPNKKIHWCKTGCELTPSGSEKLEHWWSNVFLLPIKYHKILDRCSLNHCRFEVIILSMFEVTDIMVLLMISMFNCVPNVHHACAIHNCYRHSVAKTMFCIKGFLKVGILWNSRIIFTISSFYITLLWLKTYIKANTLCQ